MKRFVPLSWAIATLLSLFVLSLFTLSPLPAIASAVATGLAGTESAGIGPVKTEHVQVQLISEVEAIQPGAPFWVALRFEIEPDWHLYWRNPGDSGAPTRIDWTLPPGFEVGEIVWPHPERLPAGPLLNFGYEDEVLLLSQVIPPKEFERLGEILPVDSAVDSTVKSEGDPTVIQLQADADWLVCNIDCIPEKAVLNLTLPLSTSSASTPQNPALQVSPAETRLDLRWAKDFEQTRQALPQVAPWPITAEGSPEALLLTVKAPDLEVASLEQVSFFPDQDGVIVNAAEQKFTLDSQGLTLRLQRGYLADLEQLTGVLVLRGQAEGSIAQAFKVETAIAPLSPENILPSPPVAQATSSIPLWQVFGLAGLGGIVLNLMPCVFPVLSLKALNLLQKAQKSPQQVRWQALSFTSGILVSFALIAGCLLLLRSWGQQIGWGFQLQSPPFVMLMAYLMFGVGLNLSGVFVFGAGVMGMGQRLTDRAGYLGEFFTGVFATVVATPCTAPFMATAMGIALTQPVGVAIAIFEVLGLGFALPYVLLSLMPGLQRRLPKPGAWMETLQQFLAFPMYAATAWLVWVLTQQAGPGGLAAALAGLIGLGLAAWIYRKTQFGNRTWQRLGAIAAIAIVVFALTLAQTPTISHPHLPTSAQAAASDAEIPWEPYSAERLSELRQAGKPVFVEFTADWCITCLVNQQVTLSQPEVISAFGTQGVAYLKGDWTSRDRTITAALESFGRSGVPLYVLYPGQPLDSTGTVDPKEWADPIVLPQILSVAQIRESLEKL